MENSPKPTLPDILAPASESSDTGEMSLDRLSQAFASMLGKQHDSDTEATALAPGTAGEDAADAACEISPRTILEAMLFVGRPDNLPLSAEQLAGLMRGTTAAEVQKFVAELNKRYAAEGRPYEVIAEGDGFRMALREQFAPIRQRYYGKLRRVRLSQAAIEVLAIVAYNEPITSDQVAKHRGGTASGQILHHLVRRQLLKVERPATKPLKAKYSTTQRFLEVFHLRNLNDLPRSEELEPH